MTRHAVHSLVLTRLVAAQVADNNMPDLLAEAKAGDNRRSDLRGSRTLLEWDGDDVQIEGDAGYRWAMWPLAWRK